MSDLACFPLMHDECVEISVKTVVEDEPRGRQVVEMTSFEKLIHTALGLEKDPLNEHSYAFSFQCCAKDGMDKDHSYFSQSSQSEQNVTDSDRDRVLPDHVYFSSNLSRTSSFKKKKKKNMQFSSNDNLLQSSYEGEKLTVLPHYRSNDSALDLTSCDTISEQYLSHENINVRTIDVRTEPRLISGISDPDISRMTIESSSSMPSSPNFKFSVVDHSYSHESLERSASKMDIVSLFLDHPYDYCEKKSNSLNALAQSDSLKRGLSNDDLSLVNNGQLKRQDFKNSPFLDHSYQSIERQRGRNNRDTVASDTKQINEIDKLQKKMFSQCLDHTYEQHPGGKKLLTPRPKGSKETVQMEMDNDTDHSYVIPSEDCEMEEDVGSSSDSGTESLNEDDDGEVLPVLDRLTHCRSLQNFRKEHAYVK
ncbi:uncharacterized protein LOC128227489 [Mya arenaria]|nr:uncharacterized protein LOC128227489 [Mya arenaria]